MSPIGVGFSKLDSEGQFHSQRLRLRPEFLCQAVETKSDLLPKLLDQPQVSLVWMGSTTGLAGVRAALEADKHVLCGLPIAGSAEDWRRILATKVANGPQVFVAALHRWDSRFLTVQSLIGGGSLGTVTELRCISRQYVPGELSVATAPGAPSVLVEKEKSHNLREAEVKTFQIQWFEMLDQLLQIVPSAVTRVQTIAAGAGRSVWVTFADGCQAHLELHRHSLAPLETGWTLEGTAGGYANGRRFRAGPDYELVDVPVEDVPTNQDAFYNSLASTLCDGEPFPITNESILRVLTLRDAVEESLRTGHVVDIPGA